MKYPAYQNYKESKPEWLGRLPTNWSVKPLKYMARIKAGSDYKHVEIDESEDGFPVIGSGGHFAFASKYLYHGESVLLGRKGTINKPLYVNGAFWVVDTMFYSQINRSAIPKYLYYCALTIPFDYYSTSTALPSMSQGDLGNHSCAYPSLEEQIQIATFLDKETAKIDTLIEKQQQLIKLLQEKRQAAISHAVTKGLYPDVKMKDSGVEWLGQVPEHWETRRVKYLFRIKKNIAGALGFDVLSITQQGIKIKDTESGEGQLSMDYSKYQKVSINDFAMNHMDLLTGWVDISKYEGVTSPDYRVFSISKENAAPEYYLYLFQMGYNDKIFYGFGQGSSQLGRWRFPTSSFRSFVMPFPPKLEQQQISEYIRKEHFKIGRLIEKCECAIELMQERRSALISAAVTGKIDVRQAA